MEFKFVHKCTQEEKEEIGENTIFITNFKKVTIFLGNKTKIIYRRDIDWFVIEELDKDRTDIDNYSKDIMGPEACSIIDTIIRRAKMQGATFIWDGYHYETFSPNSIIPTREIDFVEDEMRRKKLREKEKIDEILSLLEINDNAVVYHDEKTSLSINKFGIIHIYQKRKTEVYDQYFAVDKRFGGCLAPVEDKHKKANTKKILRDLSSIYDNDHAYEIFLNLIRSMMMAALKQKAQLYGYEE